MAAVQDDDGTTNASVDPSDIAKCALHHYQHKLSIGKPRSGDEWTIYAAIVAAQNSHQLQVVTCATGTKCTTVGPEGWVLRDSHAEVLCRRGLIRELMCEIIGGSCKLLERCGDHYFRLRADTSLHLYVSDSPCGDATIYPVVMTDNKEMNFTGAKVVVTQDKQHNGELLPVSNSKQQEDEGCCVAREDTQQLGALRTKSGRSNLPQHLRSTSMSCSDKLLRWSVLGLQGSWLPFEIRLSSVVVSKDPNATSLEGQQRALERAICHRRQEVVHELLSRNEESELIAKRLSEHSISVHVVEEQFADSNKSAVRDDASTATDAKQKESSTVNADSKKRKRVAADNGSVQNKKKRKTQKSPCGVSINWQWSNGETEVVVGARGIRQGKKPKSDSHYVKMTSRLSRASLMRLANDDDKQITSYRDCKAQKAHSSYAQARSLVFSTRPFQGWLVGTKDLDISQ